MKSDFVLPLKFFLCASSVRIALFFFELGYFFLTVIFFF